MKLFKRAFTTAAALLLSSALLPALTGPVPAATAVVPADQLGLSADAAAGSCWEIKERRSSAPSGVYWLLTPAMSAPAQFYCDQVTDGGGWVLVGKGRDGWVTDYEGKGAVTALQSPDTVPMSSATVQLPSRTVDELLNHGRVDGLAEGVRLRRAQNRTGTIWQESRFRFADKSRWTWTFGAEHPVAHWSFGFLSGRSGTTESFGSGQLYNRVVNSTDANKKWKVGFGYGSSITGYTDSSSYLWSAVNARGGALPYTQLYLRPRVTSTDAGFSAIPDAGTAARPMPASLDSDALVSPWGVSGLKGSVSVEGSVETQAFTQHGSRMYVGGNFRYVQRDAAGTGRVEQSFLAAFDITTGEWDPTFRPLLNEQVKALATLPDGTIVAGGNFSQANGRAVPAIVGLDPVTGAVRTSFNLSLENRASGGVTRVRALEVHGNDLYVGGAFTHLSGGTAPTRVVYSRNLAKVDATTLTPANDWSVDLNGSVIDIDASDDGTRVYPVGYFSTTNGAATHRVASLSTAAGAGLAGPAFTHAWSNSDNNYQQAVQQVGNRLFVGGAEHALFQFDTTSHAKLTSNVTKKGGDFQAAETDGDLVFASCHCAQWNYTGAHQWETLNTDWKQADTIKWLGVWNARSGEYVPTFTPNFAMRLGSGPWAIKSDSERTVWVGGDIETVRTTQGQKFSGGFARFRRSDSTPPPAPSNFVLQSQTSTRATFKWASVNDPAGGVTYQLLRGDRPVASVTGSTSLTVPHTGSHRYFVRAVDRAGNVGPSTPVLTVAAAAPNQAPEALFEADVTDRTVALDGAGSRDDSGVTAWQWSFGDGNSATGTAVQHTYAAAGTYTVTLTVTDAEGVSGTTSRQVTVASTRSSAVVPAGSAWQWWYRVDAPAQGWNAPGADGTGWSTGAAPLGWGHSSVATDIDTFADPASRPITAYFRRSFEITDVSRVVKLTLDTRGDDGVVVHVNGTEVGRSNMRDGLVTHTTYAPTARRVTVALREPLVVEVPVSLLRSGTNVITAETHLNYRRTPDVTFDLAATLVEE